MKSRYQLLLKQERGSEAKPATLQQIYIKVISNNLLFLLHNMEFLSYMHQIPKKDSY